MAVSIGRALVALEKLNLRHVYLRPSGAQPWQGSCQQSARDFDNTSTLSAFCAEFSGLDSTLSGPDLAGSARARGTVGHGQGALAKGKKGRTNSRAKPRTP